MVASVAVALPALRVSGDYLLIASIGFQLGMIEVIKNLSLHRRRRRPDEHPGLPRAETAGASAYVVLVVAVAVLVVLLVRWIAHSDYGRAISAMRDDEVAFARAGPRRQVDEDLDLRPGLRHRRLRRRALRPLFPLRHGGAIRNPAVRGDPDHGRGRGHPDPLGAGGRRGLLQILPQAITFLNLPPVHSWAAAGAAVHRARAGFHVLAAAVG